MNKNPKKGGKRGACYGAGIIGATAAILAALLLMSYLGLVQGNQTESQSIQVPNDTYSVVSLPDGDADSSASNTSAEAGTAEVFFIDVGQGDATLILEGDTSLLIDAGDVGWGDFLVDYIAGLGVERLDYIVATHNHADHIGGMEAVINYFDVGTFFTTATPATTATYEQMLTALESRTDIEIVIPRPGDEYTLASSGFIFLGPFNSHQEFSDQNDSSLVLKYTNGDHNFLFMADAEAATEEDLLVSHSNVSADVVRVGHHGSSTSSTAAFIEAVNPQIAVISCGAGNSYGHPHKETLETIGTNGIEVYRTDTRGTIYLSSDGGSLMIETER